MVRGQEQVRELLVGIEAHQRVQSLVQATLVSVPLKQALVWVQHQPPGQLQARHSLVAMHSILQPRAEMKDLPTHLQLHCC